MPIGSPDGDRREIGRGTHVLIRGQRKARVDRRGTRHAGRTIQAAGFEQIEFLPSFQRFDDSNGAKAEIAFTPVPIADQQPSSPECVESQLGSGQESRAVRIQHLAERRTESVSERNRETRTSVVLT